MDQSIIPEPRFNFCKRVLQGETNGSVSNASDSYILAIDLLPLTIRKLRKVLINSMKIKMSANQLMAFNRTIFIT